MINLLNIAHYLWFNFWSLNNLLLESILHLRWKWGWKLLYHRNVRHALRVQLFLHSGCRQSLVVGNVEFHQTGFQSAAADRIHDQRKLWRVRFPVCRPIYARISSELETEELGFIAEVGPEVEARRAMDAAEIEYNSLCLPRSPNDCLQVICTEVDMVKENLFCRLRCCSRERVDVELRLYSG